MSELVLSSTTTFFSGRIESVFKKAKKHGIKYLEIQPYRWTTPEEVLKLEKKYGIEVAGIHLPIWWQTPQQVLTRTLMGRLLTIVCEFYIGPAVTSPAFAIAEALNNRRPYFLIHSDIIPDMGKERFDSLKEKFNVVVENVPGEDILKLKNVAPLVFDAGHYGPHPQIEDAYRQMKPDIYHVSYEHRFLYAHDLPDESEQKTMQRLFQIHEPKYIVLETYPWVSIKKGVQLILKMILNPPL